MKQENYIYKIRSFVYHLSVGHFFVKISQVGWLV